MIQRFVRMVREWRATHRTTEELSQLSDEQLRDIGVLRGEIADIARNRHVAFH